METQFRLEKTVFENARLFETKNFTKLFRLVEEAISKTDIVQSFRVSFLELISLEGKKY